MMLPANGLHTTDSNHSFTIAPNLLDRNFSAAAPNQKWAGDITYIWTKSYNRIWCLSV
jgi:transposase InsO family protein